MILNDVATVAVGLKDADFYLARRGSADVVGMVSKDYSPEAIGIRVDRTDLIYPYYLYYWFQHLHGTGYWKPLVKGTTNLVHIRTNDVKKIPLKFTN